MFDLNTIAKLNAEAEKAYGKLKTKLNAGHVCAWPREVAPVPSNDLDGIIIPDTRRVA